MKKSKTNYEIDFSKKDEELFHEYIRVIRLLHKDLRDHTVKSGIQLEKYNYLVKNLEKKSFEYLVKVLAFLIELKNNEHREVKVAYNYLPSHAWENYKTLFRNTSFPEQEHLEKARKSVRDKWRTRPRFIKDMKKGN